jgi:predicted MFS family arabinose efflux permease
MVAATPEGAGAGLALFVTTIQVALALGSTVGGIVVTLSGIAVDFGFAAILSLLGTAVLVLTGLPAVRARAALAHR